MYSIFNIPSVNDNFGNPTVDSTDYNRKRIGLPSGNLFHYTSFVLTIQNILSEGELWLSKSTVMNDYSEIVYGCELFKSLLIKESINDDRLISLIPVCDKMALHKPEDFYILSFSENEYSRLLWDSYAHKSGFNIGFKKNFIEDLIFNNDFIQKKIYTGKEFVSTETTKQLFEIRKINESESSHIDVEYFANKVMYESKLQIQIFKDVIEYIKKLFDNNEESIINVLLGDLFEIIPFMKDESLKPEEEYRLIIKVKNSKRTQNGNKKHLKNIQRYRSVDNMLFPYIILKMNHLSYFNSICLGYTNLSDLSKNTIKDFISTLPQKIEIHEMNYTLRF